MKPSAEVSAIIDAWFASVAGGNASWPDRHVSRRPDVRLVGTDPEEWLHGARVAAFLRAEAEALGGSVAVAPGETEAFEEGSVAWGVTRPTLTLPDGSQVRPRWSAVFHREDGEWKLVQLHASVGVANREVLGAVLGDLAG